MQFDFNINGCDRYSYKPTKLRRACGMYNAVLLMKTGLKFKKLNLTLAHAGGEKSVDAGGGFP
ncbi:MAG: hypothetical protein IGS49_01320 [Chlorogloeopsis fritschii C42_A2020_084]|uniref:hypothetical protein n=1 Tax=Chlorogloeopsis fritschii TaxID=1124 RepID=UPI0019D99FB2|nr:hypothetical protein [Chlorogloeopsis fritschii]MBF2004137.1 hypothetical protein [Chlorogloeopsis fritschii C42_A2020_084]